METDERQTEDERKEEEHMIEVGIDFDFDRFDIDRWEEEWGWGTSRRICVVANIYNFYIY